VDEVVHVCLMEVSGERPRAETAPEMQDGNAGTQGAGGTRFVEVANGAKFVGNLFDAIAETVKSLCEMEIAAQTDTVDFRPEEGPADMNPVIAGIACRIPALHERGETAQPNGEKIGMEAEFMDGDIHAGAQANLVAGEDAFDEAVKAKFGEACGVRLHADPAVIVEDKGFPAEAMNNVNEFATERDDEVIDELHPVEFVLIAGGVCNVEFAAIDEVFGNEAVTVTARELVKRQRTDREIVGRPIGEEIAAAGIGTPNPHEIVEKRGESHHCSGGVSFAPVNQPFFQVRADGFVAGIELHEMLFVPMIGGVVVHGDFLPHAVCHEADGVFVKGDGTADGNDAVRIVP